MAEIEDAKDTFNSVIECKVHKELINVVNESEDAAADLDVVARDVLPAGDARRDGGRREELHGVAQRRLGAYLAQHEEGIVVDLQVQRTPLMNNLGKNDVSKNRRRWPHAKRQGATKNDLPR